MGNSDCSAVGDKVDVVCNITSVVADLLCNPTCITVAPFSVKVSPLLAAGFLRFYCPPIPPPNFS